MLDFKKFIELNEADSSAATNMEKYIVIAYNGGSEQELKNQGVKAEEYTEYKEVAEKIAKDIRAKTKASPGSMVHFGKGTGNMIDWWKGKATPKTDLYSTEGVNISLKQKGGSQLMSGLADETRSTFKAATVLMGKNSPKKLNELLKELEQVMTSVIVPGNINTIAKAISSKNVPKEIIAATGSGKEKIVKIVNKKPSDNKTKNDNVFYVTTDEYEQSMNELVDWKKAMKQITPKITKFFENNLEFKEWFTFEAATGYLKFNPDNRAKANWVVSFDPKTGSNNMIQRLDNGEGKPSAYLKEVAKRSDIRIAPKTATGSKVDSGGRSKTDSSFRMGLSPKEEKIVANLFNSYDQPKKPMIQEHIEYRINQFVKQSLILTEDSILKTISDWAKTVKDWFNKLLTEVLNIIKHLASRGLEYLIEFFGFEPKTVDVSGDIEMFFSE